MEVRHWVRGEMRRADEHNENLTCHLPTAREFELPFCSVLSDTRDGLVS